MQRTAPAGIVFRVRRYLFNVATVVSLLLSLAAASLWIRSHIYDETLHWYGDNRETSLMSDAGALDCYWLWGAQGAHIAGPTQFTFYHDPAGSGFDSRMDLVKQNKGLWSIGPLMKFAFFCARPDYKYPYVEILLPWWFVFAASAALPAIRIRRWIIRRHQYAEGHCIKCGYDLRFSPDRCPECGAAVEHCRDRIDKEVTLIHGGKNNQP